MDVKVAAGAVATELAALAVALLSTAAVDGEG
jgi:hypothetical protein